MPNSVEERAQASAQGASTEGAIKSGREPGVCLLRLRVRPGSLGEIMQFSQHQPNGGVGNANRSYRPYA